MEVEAVTASPPVPVAADQGPPSPVPADLDGPQHLWVWGNNDAGQLGLPLAHKHQLLPEPSEVLTELHFRSLAARWNPSAVIGTTETGSAYLWGAKEGSDARAPRRVGALETFECIGAAQGAAHAVYLTADGSLITSGSGEFGQIGHGDLASTSRPKVVKELRPVSTTGTVVEVACGRNFTLALTNTGHVFAFGDNTYGQLGIGNFREQRTPLSMGLPPGLPVVAVACGANHSALLDADGMVWTCGNNDHGQLGHGAEDPRNRKYPSVVRALQNRRIVAVTCGDSFTACLSGTGDVYTFGQGSEGQLGHGNTSNASVPHIVQQLASDAKHIVDIAAGSNFMLALDKQGRIYGWGSNSSGQLGTGEDEGLQIYPTRVRGLDGRVVRRVFCGADGAYAFIAPAGSPPSASLAERQTLRQISYPRFASLLAKGRETSEYSGLFDEIAVVFSSPASLNASFLTEVSGRVVLDYSAVRQFFYVVYNTVHAPGVHAVFSGVLAQCQKAIAPGSTDPPAVLRLYHILLLGLEPAIHSPESHLTAALHLFAILAALPPNHAASFRAELGRYSSDCFLQVVRCVHAFIAGVMRLPPKKIPATVRQLFNFATILHAANEAAGLVPYTALYCPALDDPDRLFGDYTVWRSNIRSGTTPGPGVLYLSDYPFLLSTNVKNSVIKREAALSRSQTLGNAVLATLVAGAPSEFYMLLPVRRDHIVEDAITHITHQTHNLKKPLKVQFVGEEGVDEGGLSKEFFQLVIRQLFDPNYGMFTYDEDTRTNWFSLTSFATPDEFRLVGYLLGLAIYNDVILDLRFPPVVYRKLMGLAPTFPDLVQAMPKLAAGLRQMLEFDGDVQATFCRSFEIDVESLGSVNTVPLVPGGSTKPVTNENRKEFVDLYTKYLLSDGVSASFAAFREGFLTVCGTEAFRLFRPEELELLICGSPVLDFRHLEEFAQYDGGYDAAHPTIRLFWETVHSLSLEEKKRLLWFVTGSDRAPIGGLSKLPFKIIRVAGETEGTPRLPSSHTCFNTLILPEYTTSEVMLERLHTALENVEGFGLR